MMRFSVSKLIIILAISLLSYQYQQPRKNDALTVGQVSTCIYQNFAFDCPYWDADCLESLQSFTNCIYGTTVQACVNGNQEISVLASNDPYPQDLITCTQSCQPQSNSNFFNTFLYNNYLNCQILGTPMPNVQFNMKGSQSSLTELNCQLSLYGDFVAPNYNLTYCLANSTNNFIQICNQKYAKLTPYQDYPFCKYASIFYCQPDPSNSSLEFLNYLSCLNNTQFLETQSIPTVQETEDCMSTQCLSECPAEDPTCQSEYLQFQHCYYGNQFQSCVYGLQQLSGLNPSDPYPDLLSQCTLQCINNQSLSSFFTQQYYYCKLGCQKTGYPFPDIQFSQKGEYEFCSSQCPTNTSNEFQQALAQFQLCQNSTIEYYKCKYYYGRQDPALYDTFCQRSGVLLCNSSSYPLSFQTYYQCIQSCQQQSYSHVLTILDVRDCQSSYQSRNCPSQDTLCLQNLLDENNCENSELYQECVIGKAKLKVLTYNDPFPYEMKNCTAMCKPKGALSDYYSKYLYSQQLYCELYSEPKVDVPLSNKGDYLQCLATQCVIDPSPLFQQALQNYTQCLSGYPFTSSCLQEQYNNLGNLELLPFCYRESHYLCYQNYTATPVSFQTYYNCMGNCQVYQTF